MPIYINVGHSPSGGKPWKHLSGDCSALIQRAAEGYPGTKIKNPDDKKPPEKSRYRRCPHCFEEGAALAGIPKVPPWHRSAIQLEAQKPPGTFWVYNIYDPLKKTAQVGKAQNLAARLQSRWRATRASRFGQDCIPWAYDRLRADPGFRPEMDACAFASEFEALAAERELRDRLEGDGWHVSSMV